MITVGEMIIVETIQKDNQNITKNRYGKENERSVKIDMTMKSHVYSKDGFESGW